MSINLPPPNVSKSYPLIGYTQNQEVAIISHFKDYLMSENTTNINDKAVYTHILQKKMSEKSNSGAARVERAWARHEATT